MAFFRVSKPRKTGAEDADEEVRSESGSDTEPARSEPDEAPGGVIMEGFLQKKARTRLGGFWPASRFRGANSAIRYLQGGPSVVYSYSSYLPNFHHF